MKKMGFAAALFMILPTVYGGDGILSRHGADGPISKRYGGSGPISERYGGSGPISSRFGKDGPVPQRSQQDRRVPAEQNQYVNGFSTATGFEEQIQTGHLAPIRSAIVYKGDTLIPAGSGYLNARSGQYYPPAGDHAVINPRNGDFIQVP